ncbi:MAG TPA: AbrB/MazE/SpoVT family DNA-binding domain-containing protein [Rhodocyclaceae bacterium]|nr:AbrB/MazE/SpoVT family DNA-binding domain-containing protein [Rhodocyclaceae bacterium]
MIQMKMSEGGRIVVPAEIRKTLGLKDGDTVLWELVDGEARLTTRHARLERARKLFQQYFPKQQGRSVVDELIAERRTEAAREDA